MTEIRPVLAESRPLAHVPDAARGVLALLQPVIRLTWLTPAIHGWILDRSVQMAGASVSLAHSRIGWLAGVVLGLG